MRDFKNIKVAVAGTGYVGLSIATLLAQHHHVTAVDVIPEKVEKLNRRVSPIQDDYIEKYLGGRSPACVGPMTADSLDPRRHLTATAYCRRGVRHHSRPDQLRPRDATTSTPRTWRRS